MKEVQKIAQKVLVLSMDILVFTWQVVRKLMLPARNRKGNVLSSLLTYFVGLLERAVSFEKSVLQRPVVFTHKYMKQGLIIAVGFLFLLSSLEWTVAPSAETPGSGSQAMVVRAATAGPVRAIRPRHMCMTVMPAAAVVASRFPVDDHSPVWTGVALMTRRWLRFGVFRI